MRLASFPSQMLDNREMEKKLTSEGSGRERTMAEKVYIFHSKIKRILCVFFFLVCFCFVLITKIQCSYK